MAAVNEKPRWVTMFPAVVANEIITFTRKELVILEIKNASDEYSLIADYELSRASCILNQKHTIIGITVDEVEQLNPAYRTKDNGPGVIIFAHGVVQYCQDSETFARQVKKNGLLAKVGRIMENKKLFD